MSSRTSTVPKDNLEYWRDFSINTLRDPARSFNDSQARAPGPAPGAPLRKVPSGLSVTFTYTGERAPSQESSCVLQHMAAPTSLNGAGPVSEADAISNLGARARKLQEQMDQGDDGTQILEAESPSPLDGPGQSLYWRVSARVDDHNSRRPIAGLASELYEEAKAVASAAPLSSGAPTLQVRLTLPTTGFRTGNPVRLVL